jgi:prolyl-tRNA synthetase
MVHDTLRPLFSSGKNRNMRYSSLFGKTTHGEQKGSKLKSHQLLVKGGFIRESAAGRYFLLPLGWRVHEKIKAVIKQEMDKAGSQEMLSPTLHPLELWKETNRTNTAGFELMKIVDRRGGEFALGGTAEEMFTDVVRKFTLSHKDLPINIYQFSNKFRDELRARGGLLRLREFIMKDAYSFDIDEAAFKKEYENMKQTYLTIFSRLGLETLVVEADNGYIGGEYCHEFQVEHPEGEGRFFVTEDGSYCAHEDVATFKHVHMNPEEEMKDFAIVEQPEWVRTMEDNLKHYGQPAWRYVKNVVYRTTEGDIVIATIRGDLEVNKNKLEHALDLVGQLEEATAEDLLAMGTKYGYVHAWGHVFTSPRKAKSGKRDCRVIYVADESLKYVKNFIGGQKEVATDSINVNYGRDFTHEVEADIAMAQAGFVIEAGQKLIEKRGIEVGNIFQLGHHYANKMANASFTASDGSKQPYYMGSYGIGLARTMATIAEMYYDDKGLKWPEIIAPYTAHLISLKGGESQAEALYAALQAAGVEVLWDERDESPGKKFADADLIGCPVRLVVSHKTGTQVEWKKRTESTYALLDTSEVLQRLTQEQ